MTKANIAKSGNVKQFSTIESEDGHTSFKVQRICRKKLETIEHATFEERGKAMNFFEDMRNPS